MINRPGLRVNAELSRRLAQQLGTHTLEQRRQASRPMQGNCYHDAIAVLGELGDEAFYCEGYAAGLIPVEHAWVSYQGEVVDVSWVADDLEENVYLPTIKVSYRRLIAALIDDNRPPPWFNHPALVEDPTKRYHQHHENLLMLLTWAAASGKMKEQDDDATT